MGSFLPPMLLCDTVADMQVAPLCLSPPNPLAQFIALTSSSYLQPLLLFCPGACLPLHAWLTELLHHVLSVEAHLPIVSSRGDRGNCYFLHSSMVESNSLWPLYFKINQAVTFLGPIFFPWGRCKLSPAPNVAMGNASNSHSPEGWPQNSIFLPRYSNNSFGKVQ